MMKILKKISLVALLFVAAIQGVNAQDVNFSQFYANPLYLNPAFAGSKVAPRLAMSYRAQWPQMVSAYSTVSASYDQYVNPLHGGVGVTLMTDRQGDHGALKTSNLGLVYAFNFQLHEDIHMSAALQMGIINTNIAWDEYLRFGDQIDPVNGFVLGTNAERPDQTSITTADFAAGLIAYGNAWYAGFAAQHLTQPNLGFYSEYRLGTKFTAHAGGLINLSAEARRTSSLGLGSPVISPNIVYQMQDGFSCFNYGVYLDWMPFMVGLWYRHSLENSDAFIFMVGAQYDYLKIGYSYDVTVSKLANNTGGSHELTLGIMLPTPSPKHKVRAVRCPSF